VSETSKWSAFAHPSYRIVDIGRTAAFLIPVNKIDLPSKEEGKTIKVSLEDFLTEKFGGYNVNPIPRVGAWTSESGQIFFDNCLEYSVAFAGKERIPELLQFLSDLAVQMKEECLFVSAGQYDALLYPSPSVFPSS